jgi:hypothetical protein
MIFKRTASFKIHWKKGSRSVQAELPLIASFQQGCWNLGDVDVCGAIHAGMTKIVF